MDGNQCDRHPSARAKARVLFLPSLNVLYLCGHCVNTRLRDYHGEYYVTYEAVKVGA